MKKIALLVAGAALTLGLCACGGGGDNGGGAASGCQLPADTGEKMVLYTVVPATYEGLPTITPAELKAKLDAGEDVIIVDVNPDGSYKTAHLPCAVHYGWSMKGFTQDPGFARSALIVTYCDCAEEEDSGHMGLSLVRDYGYRNVMLLKGGRPAWQDSGYPTEAA